MFVHDCHDAVHKLPRRLPSRVEYQTLTAELRSSGGTVLPGDRVRSVAEIGHGDLEVTGLTVARTVNGADAIVIIRNNGGSVMQKNTATVKVGGANGTQVALVNVKDLAPGEETTVTASIPAAHLNAKDQYDYKVIYLSVASETEETALYNNTAEKLLAPIAVESVALNKQSMEMSVGQKSSLTATCAPATAANKNVVWHCDNLDVLDVDPVTGQITALREGSAVVTAVTEQGNLSAQCRVLVGSGSLSVKGVSISGNDMVAVGGQIKLTAEVTPDTALNKTVQWYCDNGNCAISAGEDGTLTVTGLALGTSRITVVTADGGYTDEVTITVTDQIVPPHTGDRTPLMVCIVLMVVSAAGFSFLRRRKNT